MEITLVLLPAARDWGVLRSLFSLQSVFLAAACRVPEARVRGGGGGGEGPGKKCGSAEMLLRPGLPTRTVLT